MKFKVPSYFKFFHCLADKCTDSCCVGWEIDINDETLDKYNTLKGTLGEKIRCNICHDGTAHFKLNGDKRCPFLCQDGLCELIKHSGEALLSEICREHPRYYTVMGNAGVSGIGLACEGAAELILSTQDFSFYEYESDAEEINEDVDEEYFNLLSNVEDKIVNAVVGRFFRFCSISHQDVEQIIDINTNISNRVGEYPVFDNNKVRLVMEAVEKALTECEPFDKDFPAELSEAFCFTTKRLTEFKEFMREDFAEYSKRLFCYFIHRHLYEAFFDGTVTDKLYFCALSTIAIGAVCFNKARDGAALDMTVRRAARTYSKNIEYNTENTDRLIEFCYEKGAIVKDITTLL